MLLMPGDTMPFKELHWRILQKHSGVLLRYLHSAMLPAGAFPLHPWKGSLLL